MLLARIGEEGLAGVEGVILAVDAIDLTAAGEIADLHELLVAMLQEHVGGTDIVVVANEDEIAAEPNAAGSRTKRRWRMGARPGMYDDVLRYGIERNMGLDMGECGDDTQGVALAMQ